MTTQFCETVTVPKLIRSMIHAARYLLVRSIKPRNAFLALLCVWALTLFFTHAWPMIVAGLMSVLGEFYPTQWLSMFFEMTWGPDFRDVALSAVFVSVLLPLLIDFTAIGVLLVVLPKVVLHFAATNSLSTRSHSSSGAVWRGGRNFLLCAYVSLPLWIIPPLVVIFMPVFCGMFLMRAITAYIFGVLCHPDASKSLRSKNYWALLRAEMVLGCLAFLPTYLAFSSPFAQENSDVVLIVSVVFYALFFAWSSACLSDYCRNLKNAT